MIFQTASYIRDRYKRSKPQVKHLKTQALHGNDIVPRWFVCVR